MADNPDPPAGSGSFVDDPPDLDGAVMTADGSSWVPMRAGRDRSMRLHSTPTPPSGPGARSELPGPRTPTVTSTRSPTVTHPSLGRVAPRTPRLGHGVDRKRAERSPRCEGSPRVERGPRPRRTARWTHQPPPRALDPRNAPLRRTNRQLDPPRRLDPAPRRSDAPTGRPARPLDVSAPALGPPAASVDPPAPTVAFYRYVDTRSRREPSGAHELRGGQPRLRRRHSAGPGGAPHLLAGSILDRSRRSAGTAVPKERSRGVDDDPRRGTEPWRPVGGAGTAGGGPVPTDGRAHPRGRTSPVACHRSSPDRTAPRREPADLGPVHPAAEPVSWTITRPARSQLGSLPGRGSRPGHHPPALGSTWNAGGPDASPGPLRWS
jgi:hypothetical protein